MCLPCEQARVHMSYSEYVYSLSVRQYVRSAHSSVCVCVCVCESSSVCSPTTVHPVCTVCVSVCAECLLLCTVCSLGLLNLPRVFPPAGVPGGRHRHRDTPHTHSTAVAYGNAASGAQEEGAEHRQLLQRRP